MVDNWTVVLLLSSWSYFEWESQSKGARHSAVSHSVVAEHSSGSDVTRRALSGDSGARGAVVSHNNNANEYYGKWLHITLSTTLDWLLQPSSGQCPTLSISVVLVPNSTF